MSLVAEPEQLQPQVEAAEEKDAAASHPSSLFPSAVKDDPSDAARQPHAVKKEAGDDDAAVKAEPADGEKSNGGAAADDSASARAASSAQGTTSSRRTRRPSERVRSGAVDGDEDDAEPSPKLRKRSTRRAASMPSLSSLVAQSEINDDDALMSPRDIAPRGAMRPQVSVTGARSSGQLNDGLMSPGTPQSGAKLHRVLPAFLTKLYDIVESKESDEIIRWSPTGDSFVIVNETALSKDFLPRYFKHSNFSSFVRQLNMYGFRKLKCILGHDWEYGHNSFRRGRIDLLSEIKRRYTGAAPTTNHSRLGSAAAASNSAQQVSASGTPISGVLVSPSASTPTSGSGNGRKRARANNKPSPAILALEDLREVHERFDAICTDMGDLIRMHRKAIKANESASNTIASVQDLNQLRARLHESERVVFSILRPVLEAANAAGTPSSGTRKTPTMRANGPTVLDTVQPAADLKIDSNSLAPETAGGPPRKESKVEDHALLMLNLSSGRLPNP